MNLKEKRERYTDEFRGNKEEGNVIKPQYQK